MKKILVLIVLVISFNGFSHFGGGLRLNYNLYFYPGLRAPAAGGFLEFGNSDRISMRIGANYSPSRKESSIVQAKSRYGYTKPQFIDVSVDYKFTFYQLYYDVKRYLGDGEASFGGFYLGSGMGLNLGVGKGTADFGGYSQNIYELQESVPGSQVLAQYMIRLFLGYEIKADFGMIAPELGVSLPANSINGQIIDIVLPAYFEASVNLKF